MRPIPSRSSQRGVALAVALILLTILTLISIYAASTGSLELRMARNMQDSLDSFQAAEAGLAAVLGLVNTGADPFDGNDDLNPLGAVVPNPLSKLNDGAASIDTNVLNLLRDSECPRNKKGFSAGIIKCDYYRVESIHATPGAPVPEARSKVDQGVAKSVIGSGST